MHSAASPPAGRVHSSRRATVCCQLAHVLRSEERGPSNNVIYHDGVVLRLTGSKLNPKQSPVDPVSAAVEYGEF